MPSLDLLPKKDRDEVVRLEHIYHNDFAPKMRKHLKTLARRASEPGSRFSTRDLHSLFHDGAVHHCQRGIIDRFWRDSPQELPCSLALASRFGYLQGILPDNPESSRIEGYHVHHLLPALAARDDVAVSAFLRRFRPPFLGGHRGTDLLCTGIHSVLRDDGSLWEDFAKRLTRSRRESRFVRAMLDCVVAIHEGNDKRFASSMLEMMEFNRRTDLHLAMDKIVCVEAHAFMALAQRHSPACIRVFDRTSNLPWDAEFDQCLIQHLGLEGHGCYRSVSQVVSSWLLHLPDQIHAADLLATLDRDRTKP